VLVEGCLQWQTLGLGYPPKVRAATDAYLAEQDTLGQFIEDCCDVGADSSGNAYQQRSGELYQAYKRWSGDSNMSSVVFAMRMHEKGFEKKPTKRGKVWYGLKLTESSWIDLAQ
jgi:putative DNA primase/helicase